MPDKAAAIFLKTGVLTPQGLAAAQALKQRDGGTLSEAILRLGLLDEEHLVSAFQKNLMIPRVSAAALARVAREVLQAVPPHMAAELRVIPTDVDSTGNLTLAMVDPSDDHAADEVAAYTQRQVQRAVASPTAMREALRTHYGVFLNKPGTGGGKPAASSPANVPVAAAPAQPAAQPAPAQPAAQAQVQAAAPAPAQPAAPAAQVATPAPAKPAATATAASAPAKPAATATAAAAPAKPAAAAPAKPAAAAPAKPAAAAPAKPAAAAPAGAAPAKPAAAATAGAAPAKPAAAAPAKPAAAATAGAAPAKPAAAAPAKPAATAPAATAPKPAATAPAATAPAKPAAAAPAATAPKPAATAPAATAPAKPAATAPAATAPKPATAPVATAPAKPAAAAPVAAKPAAGAPAAAAPKPAASPRSLEALARALNPDGSPITVAQAAGGGGDAGPFAGTVEKMRTASERDQVVALLLDAMTDLAEVSGLFVLQQKQLACLDGRGADHVVMSMKWFTVAAEEDSPFNDVMTSREPHIGKISDAKRASLAALGSSEGNLLLMPLVVGQKSIGVLYGDELKRDLKPLAASLKLLTQEAAAAFTRIILQRKKQG